MIISHEVWCQDQSKNHTTQGIWMSRPRDDDHILILLPEAAFLGQCWDFVEISFRRWGFEVLRNQEPDMNKERLPNICWEAWFLSGLCKFPFRNFWKEMKEAAIDKLLQIAKGILFSRSQFQRFLFHVHPDALGNKSNLINIFFEMAGEKPNN